MKIPATLADIGRRLGVTYKLNTSVESITTDTANNRATGVVLSDGTTLTASTVICNADLVYAYNKLLPSSSYAKSLSARPASCSSLSFYWALDRQIPELKAHNIFLAEHYRASFDQIFHDQSLPSEPSFYVNVPSRVDPTAAPAGKDTIVVLCPVGHLLSSESSTPASFFTWGRKRGLAPQSPAEWDDLVNRARDAVLETMESRLNVSIRQHIVHEQLNTPSTWKSQFNLDKGAILGLSHSFFNVLCFRPSTRHKDLKGLYFVGASTHPGTGVPIVLAGARLAADQVCEDNGVAKPWGSWDAQAYEKFGDACAGKGGVSGQEREGMNGSVKNANRAPTDNGKGEYGERVKGKVARNSALDEVQGSTVSWAHVLFALVAWLAALYFRKGTFAKDSA